MNQGHIELSDEQHQAMIEPLHVVCGDCGAPATHVTRDASGVMHGFCDVDWSAHVSFAGNNGKPYGWTAE